MRREAQVKCGRSRGKNEANLKTASTMKSGKLIHIDNAGHNLHHDQRARTVELVTEFLGGI